MAQQSTSPALILQMQRMGDLILTFPLIMQLQRQAPNRPVWVVAEKGFYEPLMPVSPPATYAAWEAADRVRQEKFSCALNLSNRRSAAALLHTVAAAEKLGPLEQPDGAFRVLGPWQLYRASLTHNNRHNRIHWADMNSLDAVPLSAMASMQWPLPRPLDATSWRIGLFLGASQKEKRPPATFWAAMVRALLQLDLRPVLLGGPAEQELGRRVEDLAKAPCLNMCGRFSVAELASAMNTLALLVTPDTGPMHLAAWVGLRCLNLSMGPVNPWETGPYQPGHYILQPAMSCAGCWDCLREPAYACRDRFPPGRTAKLAAALARDKAGQRETAQSLGRAGRTHLRLFCTGRDAWGLYTLDHVAGPAPAPAREALGDFWKCFFVHRLTGASTDIETSWRRLVHETPAAAEKVRRFAAASAAALAGVLRTRKVLDMDFWRKAPPAARPLAGYMHMFLENDDYAAPAIAAALQHMEFLHDSTR